MSVFDKLGSEDKDVRTASFNIWREAPPTPDGTPREAVYHVQNTLSMTLRDVNSIDLTFATRLTLWG